MDNHKQPWKKNSEDNRKKYYYIFFFFFIISADYNIFSARYVYYFLHINIIFHIGLQYVFIPYIYYY